MRYYIVWNENRTEGVVFDNIKDAEICATGAFGIVYSTLGYEFAEIYEDEVRFAEHVEIRVITQPEDAA